MANNITKEFLEQALSTEIASFQVNSGSNVGDGYMSILYTIDVKLKANKKQLNIEDDELHLLLKCFPTNPGRQSTLTKSNIFLKELRIYDTFIPELFRFQQEEIYSNSSGDDGENKKKKQQFCKPPFAKFYYGRAIDYDSLGEQESKICTDPLDNCILMSDLRKNGGFKLKNRLVPCDLDHIKLIISTQARMHALSWAYKQSTNVQSLGNKFDFLATSAYDELLGNNKEEFMKPMLDGNVALFKGAIDDDSSIPNEAKQNYFKSLDRFKRVVSDVSCLYLSSNSPTDATLNKDNVLRLPQTCIENEEPWLVLTHGDAWLNNMMFRYDDETTTSDSDGKPVPVPVEVIFVDLQIAKEADPLGDVAYAVYTCTTAELRKEHLNDLLKLYYETFLQVCNNFGVAPLPGFDLDELHRRFHRAKAFGFAIDLFWLPMIMTDHEDIVDLEDVEVTEEGLEGLAEHFKEMAQTVKKNSSFSERVVGLVRELYENGVI